MSSLHAAIELQEKNKKQELEIFENVYKKIESAITYQISISSNNCIYQIPEFMWGYPLVNVRATMPYIIEKLVNKGFVVQQISENSLMITWSLQTIKQKLKEQTSKISIKDSSEDSIIDIISKTNKQHKKL